MSSGQSDRITPIESDAAIYKRAMSVLALLAIETLEAEQERTGKSRWPDDDMRQLLYDAATAAREGRMDDVLDYEEWFE